MSAMASKITLVSFVQSNVCSDADQIKYQKFLVTDLFAGNSPVTGEFPAQKTSYLENVSSLFFCTAYSSAELMLGKHEIRF